MQPRIILVDNDCSLSTRHDRRNLQNVLKELVKDIWTPLMGSSPGSNEPSGNFVLVQPGGWFSWNRLRAYFWQNSGTFQKTPHLVSPDDLLGFVVEPAEREDSNCKGGGFLDSLTGYFGIDDPTLLAFVAAQAALTVCATYKLAWVS